MPLSLGKIILLKEKGGMTESVPWKVDKKSRVPKEEKGAQGPREVERSLRLSRRRKGQTFFSTLLCILLKDMFLLNKNLLTNLVILKLVYCGTGSGKTFLLLVLILSS